jgi:hypothetical protein
MTSLTYQELPPSLFDPLMEGVISLPEASWLWDLALMHQETWFEPPPELENAIERLMLWQMEVDPTLH